jgi:hypothetical protein
MEMGLLFVSRSRSPCLWATFPSSSLSSVYISLRCVTSSLNPFTPRDNSVINTSRAGLEDARPDITIATMNFGHSQDMKMTYQDTFLKSFLRIPCRSRQ